MAIIEQKIYPSGHTDSKGVSIKGGFSEQREENTNDETMENQRL